MEVIDITTNRTYITYDVKIALDNGTTLDYVVDICIKPNGDRYVANYHKQQPAKMKTSERKRIKRYLEGNFLRLSTTI